MVQTEEAKILEFPKRKPGKEKARKSGLNHNREGSIRNVNGKVYVDFMYLDERVREPSGLDWNEKNAKTVREQLDRIVLAIKDCTFRFAEVFPESKKSGYFAERERKLFRPKPTPESLQCGEFFERWFELLRSSGRVTGRTLLGYKSYLDLYIKPFFGEMVFSELNATTFEQFIAWAREKHYRGKEVANATINKCFTLLKMICRSVAIENSWVSYYGPFFGFKKLPEDDPYERIVPFTLEEQDKLIAQLPDHWKPYFRFAFCSGLRPGEQISIQPNDIDWGKGLLRIRRALTRDEQGKKVMGRTKNRFSRRTIRLIPVCWMFSKIS